MAPADSRSDLSRQRRCGEEDVDEDEEYGVRQVLKELAAIKETLTAIRVMQDTGAAAGHDILDSDPVASAVPAEPVGTDDTNCIDDIDGKQATTEHSALYSNIGEESDVVFAPLPYLFESICMAIVRKPAALPMSLWEAIDVSKILNGISCGLVVKYMMGMGLGRQGDLFAESMHARPFSAPESALTAW